MSIIDSEPACITIDDAASTSGSSYAISCAAARSAPISENLLAEAQPAISVPITPTELIASTKKMPTSRFSAKTVGEQLRPPVEPSRVHRAEPALHVREHLVLHVADAERGHEEEPQDERGLHDEHEPVVGEPLVEHAHAGLRDRGVHSSTSSSSSTAPGQGFT